ncbi:hypothetical protein NKG94_15405 [Micromonospora sp. M12]
MRLRSFVTAALAAVLAAGALAPAAPAAAATADRWGSPTSRTPPCRSGPCWTPVDSGVAGRPRSPPPGPTASSSRRAGSRSASPDRSQFTGRAARDPGEPDRALLRGGSLVPVRHQRDRRRAVPQTRRHARRHPFTVLWTTSSGVLPAGTSHAYVQWGSGVVVQSYSSTGAVNTVGPLGVGQYLVRLPGVGLAALLAGNVQVTAVQPNAGPAGARSTPGTPSAATCRCTSSATTRPARSPTPTSQCRTTVGGR